MHGRIILTWPRLHWHVGYYRCDVEHYIGSVFFNVFETLLKRSYIYGFARDNVSFKGESRHGIGCATPCVIFTMIIIFL